MLPADVFPLFTPALLAAIGGLICLALEPFLGKSGKHSVLPWIGGLAMVAAGIALVSQSAAPAHFHDIFAMDPARQWLCLGILAAAAISFGGLQQTLSRDKFPGGEPYALTAFATVGALLMAMAVDTIALFIGIELASLAIYALVGLRRHRLESNEALFKYFVMGAIFSAIFLYGAALSYGATGSTHFGAAVLDGRTGLYQLGSTLLVIGLLFKVGAVPFHFWTADAYTGAPSVVTGFMAAVIKVGAFAGLGSFVLASLAQASGVHPLVGPLPLDSAVVLTAHAAETHERLGVAILIIALLSLMVGNFSALRQTSVRRMLAFSSVAHAGYVLLALVPAQAGGTVQLTGFVYYLLGYAIATAGAFAALAAVSSRDDLGDDLDGLSGQGRAHPFHGLMATVFLVSIAGIPPTVGFMGKYLIFSDLVGKGNVAAAAFGMLMAVIGAAYYLRLVITLWTGSRVEERRVAPHALSSCTLAVAAVAVIALVAAPGWLVPRTMLEKAERPEKPALTQTRGISTSQAEQPAAVEYRLIEAAPGATGAPTPVPVKAALAAPAGP